ncbi:MAG: hypothetical protein AB8G05_15720 [Oligoflexales bacterium]
MIRIKYIESELSRNFLNAARVYIATNRLGKNFENAKVNLKSTIRGYGAFDRKFEEVEVEELHLDPTDDHATLTLLGPSTTYSRNFLADSKSYPGYLVATRQSTSKKCFSNFIYAVEKVMEHFRIDKVSAQIGFWNSAVLHKAPHFKGDRIVFLFSPIKKEDEL